MPITRIALRAGKPAEYRKAVSDSIQRALVATVNVPKDDIFMSINEYDASNFIYDNQYLGVERTDDLVIVQITVNNTRTLEQKKTLYKRMVESPGLRREDVLINLVDVLKENWSFGNEVAHYAL
ncbi:MAG: YusQ-like protein [uncultured Paraburkholderia sp.]|nr:MAG: YusQ-like protein [uncultured Paraburkholderia sp.]CAH2937472.1 MAG: YusQ-like protein [uncultured Paraburkholderia sp.]